MLNVECKYELRDAELARVVCRRLGAKFVGSVRQTDTYYRLSDGRLKKREVPDEAVEWVFYHRPNRIKPRLSSFTIYSDAEAKQRWGERPMPVWVIVEKTRDVYLLGSLRIHLDDVEGLGRFLELEALVTPAQHVGACHAAVQEVIEKLGPVLGEPIALGYSDLAAREQSPDRARGSSESGDRGGAP